MRVRETTRLCVWCLLATAAEIPLYFSYSHHEARVHWFTHFFAGASAGLVLMTAVVLKTGRPAPLPLVWLLVGLCATVARLRR